MRRKTKQTNRVRLMLEILEDRRVPALFTVNTLADDNDGLGDGEVSFREALQAANAAAGPDVIDFSVAGTITLSNSLPALTGSGQLAIDGPGADLLTLQYANQATAKRILLLAANSDVSIDGLTFRNGNAGTGGAIDSQNARLTLTDCVFDNNRSAFDGGALYFIGISTNGHTMTVDGCVFSNNTSMDGGAVFAQPFAASDGGAPTQYAFTNCDFINNHAPGVAGALKASGGANSSLTLTDCTFTNNSALNHSGAIHGGFAQSSIFNIANCDFTNNSAASGGIMNMGMGAGSQVNITDSSFVGNQAQQSGGCLFLTVAGPLNISRCEFIGNQAPNSLGGSGIGGAIYVQGVGGSTNIIDSLFADNVAQQGGAVYMTTQNNLIERSTFVNNYAKTFAGAVNAANGVNKIVNSTFSGNRSDGSAGALVGSNMTIVHSTFTLNRADADGNGAGQGGAISLGFNNVMHNSIAARNFKGSGAVLEDILGGFLVAGSSNNLVGVNTSTNLVNGVNGNIVGTAASPINPLLAALADNGGLTPTHALLDGSLAIDRGANDKVFAVTDQRGFDRIADGPDAGSIATVDIGAYETSLYASTIPDQQTLEDTPIAVSFTVGDASVEEPVFVVTADNPTLLPNDAAHLAVSGAAGSYNLTMSPALNQFGVTNVTVDITLNGQTLTKSFVLTVLSVNDPPSADAGPDQEIVQGTLVTLTGAFADVDVGDAHTFAWHVEADNGQVIADGNGQAFDFTPTGPGVYTATFTVTDSSAASATDTAVITVTAPPITASATFFFKLDHWDTKEDWDFKPIYVMRQGSTATTMTVDVSSIDGSAVAGSDYDALNETLIFGPGETSKIVNLHLLNNFIYEGTETLDVVLSNPTNGGALGTPSTAVVNIADDEVLAPGNLHFWYSTGNTNEGWGSLDVGVHRSGGSVGTVTVAYTILDGPAVNTQDFVVQNGTLTFASGDMDESIHITLINDTLGESPETFTIVLSNPTGGATLGTPSSTVIKIADNDGPGMFQFITTTFTTNEGWGFAILYVQRVGGSTGAVSVDYSIVNGSTANDVNLQPGTLTFADGETMKSFNVPLVNDFLVEGTEQLFVTLTNPLGGATLGAIATATLVIADND